MVALLYHGDTNNNNLTGNGEIMIRNSILKSDQNLANFVTLRQVYRSKRAFRSAAKQIDCSKRMCMAAISLFWGINMAAVMSCKKNEIFQFTVRIHKYCIYLCISRPFTTKKSTQKIALDLYTSHTQRPDQAIQ